MIINFNSFLLLEKLSTEDFIEKAKKVHGDKYDYSLVDYKGSKSKIKIICTKHGIFEQIPSNHLNNHGCPDCVGLKKLTTSDFIKNARSIHDDKYDYSLVDYKNSKKNVKIICPKYDHGVFEQTPNSHISKKQGCPICAGNIKMTTEDFIEKSKKIHDNKYDYSLVNYKNTDTKVKIICGIPGHGIFDQSPHSHLNGTGCPKCSEKFGSQDYFIEKSKKIHDDKYDYSLVDYKNVNTKVKIICPKPGHGIFGQSPHSHLNGIGCPICQESKGEKIVKNILINYNIEYKIQKKFDECKATRKLPFDFYLPDYNTCIEYDGRQHYMEISHFNKGNDTFEKRKNFDAIKTKFCIDNKIPLIRIPYTVKDIEEYLMSRIEIIKNDEYDYENGFI